MTKPEREPSAAYRAAAACLEEGYRKGYAQGWRECREAAAEVARDSYTKRWSVTAAKIEVAISALEPPVQEG